MPIPQYLIKLYHALIGKQGTFQENLGTSVMRYTKNDRKLTQGFLLGIMKLLLQAVKIELAYLQVQTKVNFYSIPLY
jgi:hypothetical protein